MTAEKIGAPAAHWRRRKRSIPMLRDHAIRQGDITRLAFIALGKEAAITFLNTEHSDLGGRPLAVATADEAGKSKVRAFLNELAARQGGDTTPSGST